MSDFASFYQSIHGYDPFPWQQRLADTVASGSWPDALTLPTSAGKTAVIDVWLWALRSGQPGVPRRLYYLIDRRALVDAAADYAQASVGASGLNLAVVKLRGGLGVSDDEWMLDPARPAFLSTTVDQLGSRLLGRAYGVGRYSAGIHAGLAGNDALIVLDEAHLIEPLRQTLERVRAFRRQATETIEAPWHVLTMTATPVTGGQQLALNAADRKHPLLKARFGASKHAALVHAGEHPATTFAEHARTLRAGGASVVGVVVNTVDLARQVYERLAAEGEAMLLIGRARPVERDALGSELMSRCGTASRKRERPPLYVVATQTIEVGLDLDFDSLVTEIAPISALRQRFGRLDRLGAVGATQAAIVLTEGRNLPYGKESLGEATKWLRGQLKSVRGHGRVIDLGVDAVGRYPAPSQEPGREAPLLLSVDLELLFDPDVDIDVAPYLHGEKRQTDVHIVWRSALDELPGEDWADHVEARAPSALEAMPVPVRAATNWLRGLSMDVSDLDTQPMPDEDRTRPQKGRTQPATFVVWDGEAAQLTDDPGFIRAGVTIVVPASRGGCDRFGWAPMSKEPVIDLVETGAVTLGRWRGDNTRTQFAVGLAEHLRGVGKRAERFAAACGLPKHLVEALELAGRLHDVGKNDPRFQFLLGAQPGQLLAKSGVIDPRVTRELAGIPRGWRHEIASVAQRKDADALVRYLVGIHHGRGKPWLPASPDPDLWAEAGGQQWPSLHATMTSRFGYWGVAYLEAILRLADWARSVDEQAKRAASVQVAEEVEPA